MSDINTIVDNRPAIMHNFVAKLVKQAKIKKHKGRMILFHVENDQLKTIKKQQANIQFGGLDQQDQFTRKIFFLSKQLEKNNFEYYTDDDFKTNLSP